MMRAATSLLLLLALGTLRAQIGVTTFGMQVKPVVPLAYFDPSISLERPSLKGQVDLTGGMAFGMLIRFGLTNSISLETGINQIQRRYRFNLANDTSGYFAEERLRFVGYEIPLTAMVFIRLGERSYMNAAMGFSLDAYPSDAQKDVTRGRIYMYRRNWAQFGVVGNMGVEYRTERSGIIYLGGTFHRPFNDMAVADLTYYGPNFFPYDMRGVLNGGYVTVDLRYYFHEEPDRNKVRRRRESP